MKNCQNLKGALVTFAVSACAAGAIAAPFKAGNILALRVGSGATLTNAATTMSLEELSPVSTSSVNIITIPSYGTSGNRLTITGNANTEGQIHVSANGRYVIIPGYDADAGTANVVANTAAVTPRVVGRMSVADPTQIDCTTRMTGPAVWTGQNIRAATSSNGTDIWVAGSTGVGLHYVTFGTTGDSTTTQNSASNARNVSIFQGNLFGGTNTTLFQCGTGLPTSGANVSSTLFASGNDLRGWAFESFTTGVAGLLWGADGAAANRLTQYSFNGTAWSQALDWGSMGQAVVGADYGFDTSGNPVVVTAQGTSSPSSSVRMTNRSASSAGSTVIVRGDGSATFTNLLYRSVVVVRLIALSAQSVDSSHIDVTFNSDSMDAASATTAANYTISGTGQGSLAANPTSVALQGTGTNTSTYRLTWGTGSSTAGQQFTITVGAPVKDSRNNPINTQFAGNAASATPPVSGVPNWSAY